MSSSLILSLLALAGCNKPTDPPQQAAVAASPPQSPPTAPYTPPGADQLSQMVAPIALFPDKLVGQVLAGATYPEQIAAANQWLGQNPALKGDALQTAEAGQPWDVSVKSLTTFPTVLGQMATNIQWTTALGEAYVNDPADVMNAIQLLRSRAQQSGHLKTSPQLRVSTVVGSTQAADRSTYRSTYEPGDSGRSSPQPEVYAGPAVIPPPPQTIVIEPAEPDVVYVPQYNPTVVYGAPVPVYPGWVEPRPVYATSTLVETGALSFGIGVLVGAAVTHHHDWGWNAWGVNWGGPAPYSGYSGYSRYGDGGHSGGWRRPAVVYNNTTYVSKSVTVVNHVNNVNVTNNYRTINNVSNNSNNSSNDSNNNYNNVGNNSNNHGNSVVNRPQNFAASNAASRPAPVMTAPRLAPNAMAGFAPHSAPDFSPNAPRNIAFNHAPVAAAHPAATAPQAAQQHQPAAMTMPHFTQRDAVPGGRPLPAAAAAALPLHSAAAPEMNRFVANSRHAPASATMPEHEAHQWQPGQQVQQGRQANSDAPRWEPGQQVQQVQQGQQRQQAQHDTHQWQQIQPMQHDPHQIQQPQPAPHGLQAATMAPPEVQKPAHEERGGERIAAQAQLERQHADAVAQRMAQQRTSVSAPMPPATQPDRLPQHNTSPNQGQPQGNHQNMLAMHVPQPRQPEQHAGNQGGKHEPGAQSHDDHAGHQNHGNHDPHERHG